MPTPRQYANPAARQAAYRARQAEARRAELQAKGLPRLPPVATLPGAARWHALVEQACALLRTAQDEMQDYYDQRSPPWQESERGESFLERLQALAEAADAVEEIRTQSARADGSAKLGG